MHALMNASLLPRAVEFEVLKNFHLHRKFGAGHLKPSDPKQVVKCALFPYSTPTAGTKLRKNGGRPKPQSLTGLTLSPSQTPHCIKLCNSVPGKDEVVDLGAGENGGLGE